MAEHRHDQEQRFQQQQQQHRGGPTDLTKSLLPEKRPSKSQVLAVVTLLPAGGILLLLSGLTLAGTLVGLALTTPLFVICSPVLVPATLTLALAVAGFLASGTFGVTALSSLSWAVNCVRRSGMLPGPLDQAARHVQEATGQIGQKAREVGQKAQEVGGPGGRSPGRS
ncbi:hypothetical protein RHGRI_024399 [Rhododendron griersonianum]|uniref:Oleosin n=1 Tax=Rhododendron griersonianum TaxID=479676 RepID=A0AAV6JBL6_9ERIC|nr:hypothetical protein RHGRI_024399 [Rhododendron griersonianum]